MGRFVRHVTCYATKVPSSLRSTVLGRKIFSLNGYVILRLPRTQLGVERAAVLMLGSLRESSKSLTTKENRREETVPYS